MWGMTFSLEYIVITPNWYTEKSPRSTFKMIDVVRHRLVKAIIDAYERNA